MIVSRVLVATLLSAFATALPHRVRDSAINEPAVSAPNGTPITEGAEPMYVGFEFMCYFKTDLRLGPPPPITARRTRRLAPAWSPVLLPKSPRKLHLLLFLKSSRKLHLLLSPGTPTRLPPTVPGVPTGEVGVAPTTTTACPVSTELWNTDSKLLTAHTECLAQYGNSPQPWTPPTQTTPDSGSGGTGVTHTVIVAPSQGVLRYVPFAVNASVGDTVMFMWGANNHTVTKSSSLAPCNKTDDTPFASGIQVKDFVCEYSILFKLHLILILLLQLVTQVVNDTNPTFFHCAVPSHCQKGMFGIMLVPLVYSVSSSIANGVVVQ